MIFYLRRESIVETLSNLAACSGSGSELVLDYWTPHDGLEGAELKYAKEFERFVTRLGEPIVTHLSPESMADLAAETGFKVVEDLSADQQAARYFKEGRPNFKPPPISRIAHLIRD